MANGIMGQFLHIHLNEKTMDIRQMYNEYLKTYLGGAAISSKIIWDKVQELEKKGKKVKDMDAFDPDNLLIFATGPGTGVTGFPSPGRHHIMTIKSPLTGSIGSANSGGNWGAYLKRAGYDGIVFEGKADKPMYLSIIDGKAELHDAAHIWGKDIFETNQILLDEYESTGFKLSVACVSPAAEKGSPITGVINDAHRAAGRTGIGAVMASKNLKAVIVGGAKKVEVNNPEKFKEVSKKMLTKLKENGLTGEGLPAYGTAILVNVINGTGSLPQNNWQFGSSDKSENISGETLAKEYLRKKQPCWGCSIACGRATKVESGPYAIAETEGPEYESIWAFGNDCGIYEFPPIIMANHLCDKYGLDTITMGSTIGCAMELAEKGFIPKDDYKGIDLKFGSGAGLVEAVRQTGEFIGFGQKLAKGSRWLSKHYGHPEFSMSVKGLEMPAYDPRGIKGIGLNYATSNRGGCHVTGYTIAPEIAGLPEQIDRLAYEGKATWVKIFQDFTAAVNSTVNCLFTTFALGADDFAELLSVVTGWDINAAKFLEIGEKTYNMQRMIMEKLGVEKDTLPNRLLKTPMPEGVSKGEIEELDKMLPEYYKLRGWNEKGFPTAEKIKDLNI